MTGNTTQEETGPMKERSPMTPEWQDSRPEES
jgi:hypothetical protein